MCPPSLLLTFLEAVLGTPRLHRYGPGVFPFLPNSHFKGGQERGSPQLSKTGAGSPVSLPHPTQPNALHPLVTLSLSAEAGW